VNFSESEVNLNPFSLLFEHGLFDPMSGTGVQWSVSAQALLSQGLFLTGVSAMEVSSTTDYYMRVVVDGTTYALPGNAGTSVIASTVYSTSGITGAVADVASQIETTSIGGVFNFSAEGTSPSFSASHNRGHSYSLQHIYEISIFGSSSPSQANLSVTTSVIVPEPSAISIASFLGTLACLLAARRKGK